MACAGCLCCGKEKYVRPGCKENRSCTDIIFLIIYLAFWAVLIFIAYTGYSQGNLNRLLYGTDHSGNICGIADANTPNDTTLDDPLNDYGKVWTNRSLIWYPITTDLLTEANPTLTSIATTATKLGICVDRCPTTDPTTVWDYTNGDEWPVYYASINVLNRCVPDPNSNATLSIVKDVLNEFTALTGFTSFASYAEEEFLNSWKVMIVNLALAFVICFVFIFLMRWVVGVFVYVVLVLCWLFLIGSGLLCLWKAEDIKNNYDSAADAQSYVIWLQIGAGVLFFVALIYLLLMIFLIKRIRIAIEIMKLSAKVMISAPTMILVPPCTMIFIVAACVWFASVGAFLHSAGEITVEDITVSNPFGGGNYTLQSSVLNENTNLRWYAQLVNIFGFLWTLGLFNAISFMAISFVTVMYYFSDPWPGDNKKTPIGAVCTGVWWTFRYHLGTVAFGSLIIAIIQMIRFMMAYLQKKIEAGQNDAVKWAGRCIQCYLACLERVVSYVNLNAYIVCCIQSSNFCASAYKAVELLLSNLSDVAASNFIADAVFLFCKATITMLNCFLCYMLLRTSLADGNSNTVSYFVIALVGLVTWIVSSIFMHLYDSVQDTVLMCFVWDKDENNGVDRPYYFNDGLANIINKVNAPSGNRVHPEVVTTTQ